MPVFSYRTLNAPSAGVYKEKGSKFLAFAYPVTSEAAVKEKLDLLRKQYFDARHHCYAWMLGADKKRFRANDDGEPNHSAGDPILGQIRSKDLTDVLIVVVRYFGGVKLGVGGLIGAYKAAAEDALLHAVVEEKDVTRAVTLAYNYPATPEIMRLVKEFDLAIVSQDFGDACRLVVNVKEKVYQSFSDRVAWMNALGTTVKAEDFQS